MKITDITFGGRYQRSDSELIITIDDDGHITGIDGFGRPAIIDLFDIWSDWIELAD